MFTRVPLYLLEEPYCFLPSQEGRTGRYDPPPAILFQFYVIVFIARPQKKNIYNKIFTVFWVFYVEPIMP